MPQYRPLSETKFINDANLIGYWKLDGNSTDETSNNNDGTDTDITYNASYAVNANFGQGALFDGNSSYIQLGNFASQTQMSIFAWVYCAGTTGAIQCILATPATSPTNGFHLQTADTTGDTNAIYNNTVYDVSFPLATVAQLSGGWHYYGFTSKNGETKTYLDGVQLGATNTTAYTTIDAATAPTVGRGYNSVRWFNGKIDDISYFSRALSSAEVNELYQGMTLGEYLGAGPTSVNRELDAIPSLRNDANLLNYWKLESNSNDEENVLNGTDANVSYSAGKFGNGGVYNGSNSYSDLGTNVSSLNLSAFSVNGWFNTDTITGSVVRSILCNSIYSQNGGITYSDGWSIFVYDNKVYCYIGKSTASYSVTQINTVSTIATGTWYHVAITYDGTNLKIYLNGKFEATGTGTVVYGTTKKTYIGGTYQNVNGTGTNVNIFDGMIDDLSFFSRALSASEVNDLYQSGSTKLLLHLNGNSTDSSGNGNNGADTNVVYTSIFNPVTSGSATGQGVAYHNGTSWAVARAGAGSGHGHGATNASDTIGGSYNNGASSKYVYRGFFPFAVAGIPLGANIIGAKLRVYIDTVVGSPIIGLIQTTQASATDLANGDYDAITLDSPSEGATRVTVANTQYNEWIFNATGLSWLPAPGTDATVKLGTREARDIDNGLDDTNTYCNGRWPSYTGTNPELVITYTMPGKFGSAARYNGTDSITTVTHATSLNLGTADATVSCWFKCHSSNEYQPIVTKEKATANYNHVMLGVWNDNKVYFSLSDCGTSACGWGTTKTFVFSTNTVNDGKWHQVVGVRISTGFLLYLDGVLNNTRSENTTDCNSTANLLLAKDGNSNFGNISLEEFRIDAYAWTAAEVRKAYTYQTGRFGII